MDFAVSGVSQQGHVPQAPGQMPNYIQIRLNGVDVGGPDATVIDFVGAGWVVTRGTGLNVNTISVSLG